ncbi:unnamed protein product [Echinostoma caproni]|uniref:RRM domain-containing protein n=1 Tax=Echinostoma caproni TaxID=27848 RepID=A0A183A916_9TREM|nr:unnamed protein product [Echinostoma caproni]
MSSAPKRGRYGALAVATAQFYNTTGTVPSQLHLAPDISYLITTQPSCTIVVCELPGGCNEQELQGLFARFGQVKRTKIVCNGRAALVEFCEISTPTRLVHMAKTNPFFVGTSIVRLEFSSEAIAMSNEAKVPSDKPATTSEPTRILHLDIAAADYPITVDVIKAICAPHGQIQRIFIGKKNVDRSLEALVEFQSIEEAKAVKQQLDGADIYSGCCSLTVTYSQIPKVHVTKNDSESWDFTGPNAGVQGPLNNSANQRTLLSISATTANTMSSPLVQPPPSALPAPAACVPPTPYVQPAHSYPPHMVPSATNTQMGYYAMPPYMPPPPNAPPPMYGQMPAPHPGAYGAPAPYMGYNGPNQRPAVRPPVQTAFPASATVVILPTPPSTHPVSPKGIGLGHATSNLSSTSSTAHPTDVSVFESMEGVVLMACNLPTHLNCDHLFNLLCLYGNIARIKFLKTRPGCAMIQVGTAEVADLIHRYYDSITIFDRTIQFYHSKQPELTEHENLGVLEDGSPVMKNYMNDPNNRFRNVIVASRSRILEPSRTLHFFNTPLYITPEDVSTVFTNAGVKSPPRIVIFTAKHGQKTSLGLVEWDTLSEALEALALLNHYPIHVSGVSHPFHMKLAFSPKPISNDRVGQSLIRYPAPPLTTEVRSTSHTTSRPEAEDILANEDEDNPGAAVDADKNNDSHLSVSNGVRGSSPSPEEHLGSKSDLQTIVLPVMLPMEIPSLFSLPASNSVQVSPRLPPSVEALVHPRPYWTTDALEALLVSGGNIGSLTEDIVLHRLRWAVMFCICLPVDCLAVLSARIGQGWKKLRGGQTMTWCRGIKKPVGAAQNRCQCRGCYAVCLAKPRSP